MCVHVCVQFVCVCVMLDQQKDGDQLMDYNVAVWYT